MPQPRHSAKKSMRMAAVLFVTLAATVLEVAAAQGRILPGKHSIQLPTGHTKHPNLSFFGSSTLAFQIRAYMVGCPYSLSYSTPQQYKDRSRVYNHVKRKKRSLLAGTSNVQENRTVDQNPAKPLGKNTDLLSLSLLLTAMAHRLSNCELVLAYDDHYSDPEVLEGVIVLPTVKQIVHVKTIEDFKRLVWVAPGCRGYFLLLHQTEMLLTFLDNNRDAWDYDGSEGNTRVESSLSSAWLDTYGLHLRENQTRPPQRGSTQVLVSFLWLYTMILTIAYCTNLTAFILVNKPPPSIQTLVELADSNLDVVGVGDIFKKLLLEASDPNVKALADNYKGEGSKNEAFRQVLTGRAVFLENHHFVEFVAHTKFMKGGVGRTRVMEECFAPHYIAIGLQRRTPLKRKVDEVISWLQQGGLIRHSFLGSLRMAASIERATSDAEALGETDAGKLTALNLDHLQGSFLINLVGLLLAALSFLVERCLAPKDK